MKRINSKIREDGCEVALFYNYLEDIYEITLRLSTGGMRLPVGRSDSRGAADRLYNDIIMGRA